VGEQSAYPSKAGCGWAVTRLHYYVGPQAAEIFRRSESDNSSSGGVGAAAFYKIGIPRISGKRSGSHIADILRPKRREEKMSRRGTGTALVKKCGKGTWRQVLISLKNSEVLTSRYYLTSKLSAQKLGF